MKKGLIILFTIIDILVLVIYINLYNDYNNDREKLLSMISGSDYDEFILGIEKERNQIIKDIDTTTKYELNNIDEFDKIKNELSSKYENLKSENSDLVKKRDNLSKQKSDLSKIYNNILEEERKKSTYKIEGFPLINQYSLGYPTGCESAALTNLLKFWGVSVSMSDVVRALPKGSLPYYENSIKYGGNPYIEFVGNPSSSSSYGVYEKPIIGVANKFKSGIINGTGKNLSSILDIVKEGRPVIAWVSMNMAVPYISTSWIYKPTGEKISWMANEHALVIVGYNESQVIVSDSLNGKIRYYDKKVFENRYNTYGKRALYY